VAAFEEPAWFKNEWILRVRLSIFLGGEAIRELILNTLSASLSFDLKRGLKSALKRYYSSINRFEQLFTEPSDR